MFQDRKDAGEKLGIVLKDRNYHSPVIFGIPRGGVVVAAEVAKILDAPLSIVVPRKIGAPFNPEYGIGAVAPDGSFILDKQAAKSVSANEDYINEQVEIELKEARRRLKEYGFKIPEDLSGMTAIVVDDGVATGHTMIAAVMFLEKLNPDSVVVAVPVAPQDSVEKMLKYADDVVVLYTPLFFSAVGEFYYDFHQISDDEVKEAIKNIKLIFTDTGKEDD